MHLGTMSSSNLRWITWGVRPRDYFMENVITDFYSRVEKTVFSDKYQ